MNISLRFSWTPSSDDHTYTPSISREHLVYIAARTDPIQWTISGHSTISLSIVVLMWLVDLIYLGSCSTCVFIWESFSNWECRVLGSCCTFLFTFVEVLIPFKVWFALSAQLISLFIHIECLVSRVFTLKSKPVLFYPSANYLFPAWRDRFVYSFIYLNLYLNLSYRIL